MVEQRQRLRFLPETLLKALPKLHEPGGASYPFLCCLSDPGEEKAKPPGPVSVRSDPLEVIVVTLAMRLEVGGEVEQRLEEPAALDQEERDQESADPAVPVEEGMDRLELLVDQRALD